ncbi:MBL fold metallo-hydrolase [Oceanobacillus sp. CAU 1775]
MKVEQKSVGFIGTNCYILSIGEQTLVLDPGGDPEQIINYLENNALKPQAILLTHAHFDHIGGLEALRATYQLDTYIHEQEQEWLGDPSLNGSHKLVGNEIVTNPAEKTFEIGELTIGDFTFDVIHTPGHSPGSVSFVFHQSKEIFGGDVLFRQGIGRTDLRGGDYSILEHSIKEKLYTLDDDYTVYPGHGPRTTIGFEKINNPFIRI